MAFVLQLGKCFAFLYQRKLQHRRPDQRRVQLLPPVHKNKHRVKVGRKPARKQAGNRVVHTIAPSARARVAA